MQALMTLLGHRSPEMTIRYARLASPTLKAGGPVTSGAADPANGGGRGDPEQVGQHGGGKASTQVQERASPSGHGRDAEASEPLAEMRGPEGGPRWR
jgi:hypothetical protein